MPSPTDNQPPSFSTLALAEPLLTALAKQGFDRPTPVQHQAIPLALAHKDLKVSAETGSGKTAAFLLPALHHALENSSEPSGLCALILAPTRELARQIYQQGRQLSEFTGLQIGLITGGEDFKSQQKTIRKKPDILISTPGRLLELTEQSPQILSDLRMLILDEADRMLDMGFSREVLAIVERCNRHRQTLLFSATLNHNGVNTIADRILLKPDIVALNALHDQHSQIEQQIVLADDAEHKRKLLAWLLLNESYDIALVFTNSRLQADQLQGPLRGQKLRVGVLHGDMEQKERNRIMSLLASGAINILIATDLAARGLDVPGVELVVNFDVPRNGVDYTHRIGRTGRGVSTGKAITLVKATEWNLMSAIERYLKLSCRRRTIEGLKGHYSGPKRLKASGKAAGSKIRPPAKKAAAEKVKIRHRDKKNIGKRRAPGNKAPAVSAE
ncbi:MAG: DEAD/DEAH box helicase [Gammaproteobacteria bacterium]